MKVKLKQAVSGPAGTWMDGMIIEVSNSEAARLVPLFAEEVIYESKDKRIEVVEQAIAPETKAESAISVVEKMLLRPKK